MGVDNLSGNGRNGSEPDGPSELYRLAEMIAAAKNPQVHFNTQKVDVPEAERRAIIATLEGEMNDLLRGGASRDFINGELSKALKRF